MPEELVERLRARLARPYAEQTQKYFGPYEMGERDENARLRPLHEKLLECVAVLETVKWIRESGHDLSPSDYIAQSEDLDKRVANALASLGEE